jgi:3-oxoacyl-[acyl-carrier-protein] synthase II
LGRRRRVVITGLGVVAPNGIGKQAFWDSLVAGKSAVDYISAFDASDFPCKVAAEVRDFHPEQFMNPRRVKHRGRFSQFAVAASKLALEDARLVLAQERSSRVLACLGTSANGVGDVYEGARLGFQTAGVRGIPQVAGIEYAAHAASGHVSVELGLKGQIATLASACATGLDAVHWGSQHIAANAADVIIAGATDAPVSPLCFATFCASGTLSRFDDPAIRASRPYDLRRDGFVLGEGAAMFVLEEWDHAVARGASIYAAVRGFGSGNEGGYAAKTDAGELALVDALTSAVRDSQLSLDDIDHINAHGNALPDYDLTETRAFKRAFGRAAFSMPITSIKSMVGHAMGAASALQVAAACLTLRHSAIPPTINLETRDPECDLDYVASEARVSRVRNVLLNAHALGGTHSVLILGQP